MILQKIDQALRAQRRRHTRLQLDRFERLMDVIRTAYFERARDLFRAGVAGDENHRNIRRHFALFEQLTHMQAAHPRQYDIEQNHIRLRFDRKREPFFGTRGMQNLFRKIAKLLVDHGVDQRIVVDYEQGVLFHFSLHVF